MLASSLEKMKTGMHIDHVGEITATDGSSLHSHALGPPMQHPSGLSNIFGYCNDQAPVSNTGIHEEWGVPLEPLIMLNVESRKFVV